MFHVKLQRRSFLFIADSNNLSSELYDHVHRHIGDTERLFIGMECVGAPVSWAYGPLLDKPLERRDDQSRRLNGCDFQGALDIVRRLNPRAVYVYAMGQEPWLAHLSSIEYTAESEALIQSDKLVDECRRQGITAERLFGCRTLD